MSPLRSRPLAALCLVAALVGTGGTGACGGSSDGDDAPDNGDGGGGDGDGGGSGSGDGGGGSGATLVLDGAPGSRIPSFDSANPAPLIVLARRVQPAAWVVALVDIASDGTVGGIVNYDRLRVFQPTRTTLLVDAAYPGARLSSWSPSAPVPLVLLARRSGQSTWVTGIAQILDDGTITGITNIDRVRAWRVDDVPAPFHDGAVATAVVPSWNAAAPGPLLLGASRTAMPGWIIGIASITADGHLGDIVADRIVGWLP